MLNFPLKSWSLLDPKKRRRHLSTAPLALQRQRHVYLRRQIVLLYKNSPYSTLHFLPTPQVFVFPCHYLYLNNSPTLHSFQYFVAVEFPYSIHWYTLALESLHLLVPGQRYWPSSIQNRKQRLKSIETFLINLACTTSNVNSFWLILLTTANINTIADMRIFLFLDFILFYFYFSSKMYVFSL